MMVGVDHSSAPLIGRSAELAELLSAVGVVAGPDHEVASTTGAAAAHGGSVLLGGDAGVGKTRILAELRTHAVDAGMRVLVGHCVDFGDSAPPYLPFAEMFGRLAADDPDTSRKLAERHPAASRLVFRDADPTGARVGRGDLFDDVHAALSELALTSPVLVVVEDAHWADRSTQDMLSLLFTRGFATTGAVGLPQAPVSIVVSYRTDDLHRRHPLRPALAEWGRLPDVTRLVLSPLPDADVGRLVRSLSVLRPELEPMAESTVHNIIVRAEGNPFFTEELVGAAASGADRVPDDLAGLLLIRLDSLDESARAVVRAASVSGRQVTHDLLAQVTDVTGDALDAAVRTAVERNVLVAAANGYSFRHALLAETVYADLLPGERVRLHARYVAALVSAGSAADPADLARHARAAHDTETAARAGLRAAEQAMEVGGPDEAAQQYEHLLELLARSPDLVPDFDRIELGAAWVDALSAAGHSVRAIAVARELVADLPADVDAETRATALAVLAHAALIEDSWLALESAERGLELVPAQPRLDAPRAFPGRARARLLSAYARACMGNRRFDEAVQAAGEAMVLGERLGMSEVVADATTTLARLKNYTGDPKSSAEALTAIIDSAQNRGDIAVELRAWHHLGGVYLGLADLARAFDAYRAGTDRATRLGRPWAPSGIDCRVLAAITAHMSGDWQAADDLVDLSGTNPPALAEAALRAAGLLVSANRGRFAEAVELAGIRRYWSFDGMIAVTAVYAGIDLYGDAGDLAGAIAIHDEGVAVLTEIWAMSSFDARIRLSALLLGHLATGAVTAGQADRRDLVDRGRQLLAAAQQTHAEVEAGGTVGPETSAWFSRATAESARLSWIAGIEPPSVAELSRRWEAAVDGFARQGNPFEEARSRARWAAALAADRSPQALEVAAPALAVAERLGALPLQRELAALGLVGVPAPARRRAGSHAGRVDQQKLTPRESEILALVAQGRSNGEIGRRLFISAKTVSVHVSNILAKLGAAGRTEAAAIGRDRGLI